MRSPNANRARSARSGVGTHPRVASFPPQIGAACRVLVLGTAPSIASLALRQSYAHAYNLFWPFMGEMFDAGPQLPYTERVTRLHAQGVGIWDVLASCERTGSLDASIVRASEIANDIPELLLTQPTIAAVALNGGRALEVFTRRIAPRIEAARLTRLAILALPSTSPANASMRREIKLERWRELAAWARTPGP